MFWRNSGRLLARAVALVTMAASVACGSRITDRCATSADCREQQYCDSSTKLCVLNEPPTIALAMPRAGETLTESIVEISGTVTDDENALRSLEVSADRGTTWTRVATTQRGEFIERVSLPALDSRPYALHLRAVDAQGLVGKLVVDFAVDSVAPTCEFVTPLDGEKVGLRPDRRVPIQVRSLDGSGTPLVKLIAGEQELPLVPSEEGLFIGELPLTETNATPIALTLSAVDFTGLTCTRSITIVSDQVAPTIAFTSPDAGTLFNASRAVAKFTGTAADEGNPVQVLVDFGDDAGFREAVLADGAWSLEIPLPEEDFTEHRVRAIARDATGNEAADELVVKVDRLKPRITLLTPDLTRALNASDFPSNSDSFRLAWSIEEATPITQTIKYPGGNVWIPRGADVRDHHVTTQSTDNGVQYSLGLIVFDGSGNSQSVTWAVTVDRVAPTFSFQPTSGEQYFTGNAAQVQFSEEIKPGTSTTAVSIAPNAPMTWAPRFIEFSGFTPDTRYVINVPEGSVQDLAGNPARRFAFWSFNSSSFTTSVKLPPPGVLPISSFDSFDAANDSSGAVTIVVARSPAHSEHYEMFRMNTLTGAVESRGTFTNYLPPASLQVHAGLQHLVSGAKERLRGVMPSEGSGRVWGDPTSVTSNGIGPQVLVGEPCSDSSSPSVGGYDGMYFYRNALRASYGDLSLEPKNTLVGSKLFWAGVSFSAATTGGMLSHQGVRCRCVPSTSGGATTPYCDKDVVQTFTAPDLATLRRSWSGVALENGVAIHTFASGGQTQERCITHADCSTSSCTPAVTATVHPYSEVRLGVGADGIPFRYERLDNGNLRLRHRNGVTCDSGWSPTASPEISAADVVEFRAIRIGKTPAVLMSRPRSAGGRELVLHH